MATVSYSHDYATYRLSEFRIENNVWGKSLLGFDGNQYFSSITFDTADLSRNVSFEWDWGSEYEHMLAYPEIMVGKKPTDPWGKDQINSVVSDLKTFEVTHDVSISGDTDIFNVSYSMWLTDVPLGDTSSITTEVMVWAHRGDLGYMGKDAVAGTYRQGQYKFDVVTVDDHGGYNGVSWRYIALLPRQDYLEATFDMKAILNFLVRRGLVSDDDFVTGYELGAEVKGGKGQFDIHSMSYEFDTYNADDESNHIVGTIGNDRIGGLAGDDRILGGKGRDFVDGGLGSDVLTGGAGRDLFFFDPELGANDHITDFRHGIDKIKIERSIFGNVALSANDLTFSAQSNHENGNGHFRYDRSSGELFLDVDGSRSNLDLEPFLTLDNNPKLTWSDFTLV
jgi:hypothetical protein